MSSRLRRVLLASVLTLGLACQGSSGTKGPPPVADAGPDADVFKGDRVTLDASASLDPDGERLSFEWRQVAGPEVELVAAGPIASFRAPRVSGVLRFAVTVRNARASRSDEVVVHVHNRVPVADAGSDLVVREGYVITLDGRGSRDDDGDPLTFQWFQTSGPLVALLDASPGTIRFVAPSTTAVLGFELVVSDGEDASSVDDVRVQVRGAGANLPPVADAGPDQTVAKRARVRLYGSASDPDLDPVTVVWEQTAGPAVVLTGAGSPRAEFDAPAETGALVFRLTASDGMDTGTDEIVVHVRNAPPQIQSIAIAPAVPITTDDLAASLAAVDPDGDPLSTTWTWTRNGALIPGRSASILPAADTTKGDVLVATATVSDGVETATATATATIADAPAVLSAAPPAEVAAGDTFAFDVTVSDPDGDPVPDRLLVHHGPAGFGTGGLRVSWPAALPMFGPSLDVHWAVGVEGSPTALAGTVRVLDADRAPPLRRAGVEIPLGHGALRVADLDGDGSLEMLVASNLGLYELGFDGATYRQRWMQPFPFDAGWTSQGYFAGAPARAAAADVEGDAAAEIFASEGDLVVKLDGRTRRELARRDGVACAQLEVADVDADGGAEVVCLADGDPYGSGRRVVVLDAADLSTRWETASIALGTAMAVGDVDGDAALEIVTSAGYVFDGATSANEWAYSAGFGGGAVDTGDLDGDGVEEIVGLTAGFKAFSAVLESALFEQAVGYGGVADVIVTDLDGDGRSEIVVGESQWGDVTGWRYSSATNTVTKLFGVGSQDHGVSGLAAGDVDGDGRTELAWGSGWSSSGGDVFVIAGLDPGVDSGIEIAWRGGDPEQLDSAFVGGRLARLGGGRSALVFGVARTNSGYAGSRIVTLDPATGVVALTPELDTSWGGQVALDVVDYDGDGVDEVIFGTTTFSGGSLVAYDVAAGTAEWTSPAAVGTARATAHGDLDGDGDLDLVAITSDGVVSAWDPKGAALLWTSISLGSGRGVAVSDLDGDGVPEIVAASGTGVTVFRKAPAPYGWLEGGSFRTSAIALLVGDVEGDGAEDVFVLAATSPYGDATSVIRLDGALAPVATIEIPAGTSSLALEDLPGRRNLILTRGGAYPYDTASTDLRAVDAASGAEVWRSPNLGWSVSRESVWYADWNGDGARELAFGSAGGMFVTR